MRRLFSSKHISSGLHLKAGALLVILIATAGGAQVQDPNGTDRNAIMVAAGKDERINFHGTCRQVSNQGTTGILVPVNSSPEWNSGSNAFLQNISGMPGVSVTNCQRLFHDDVLDHKVKIYSPNPGVNHQFHLTSISADGSLIVAVEPKNKGEAGDKIGKVYVFRSSGAGDPVLIQTISAAKAGDNFVDAKISSDGLRLAITTMPSRPVFVTEDPDPVLQFYRFNASQDRFNLAWTHQSFAARGYVMKVADATSGAASNSTVGNYAVVSSGYAISNFNTSFQLPGMVENNTDLSWVATANFHNNTGYFVRYADQNTNIHGLYQVRLIESAIGSGEANTLGNPTPIRRVPAALLSATTPMGWTGAGVISNSPDLQYLSVHASVRLGKTRVEDVRIMKWNGSAYTLLHREVLPTPNPADTGGASGLMSAGTHNVFSSVSKSGDVYISWGYLGTSSSATYTQPVYQHATYLSMKPDGTYQVNQDPWGGDIFGDPGQGFAQFAETKGDLVVGMPGDDTKAANAGAGVLVYGMRYLQ